MNGHPPFVPLGDAFERAFLLASELHRTQSRKHGRIPYISHLMCVAGMVLEHGGDENQAIAALLHDGPEDQGGVATLERIEREFGADVAALVSACSEPLGLTRAEWRPRKDGYLAHLAALDARALLIAGCDKVHNASNLLSLLETEGVEAFGRFNGGVQGTIWWYSTLADRLGPRLPRPLGRELKRLASGIAEYGRAHP
jgi:(p)ppGpp synthase/HD superfamily hydrolase